MKRELSLVVVFVLIITLLGGCATVPIGPTAAVMPAPGKPFQMFQQEQKECQDYALQQIGGQAAIDADNAKAVGHAVVGTLIGVTVGALLGVGLRRPEGIVGAGAAVGLAAGTSSGAGAAAGSSAARQHLYNVAFMQCMYSKGNQVPQMVQ